MVQCAMFEVAILNSFSDMGSPRYISRFALRILRSDSSLKPRAKLDKKTTAAAMASGLWCALIPVSSLLQLEPEQRISEPVQYDDLV